MPRSSQLCKQPNSNSQTNRGQDNRVETKSRIQEAQTLTSTLQKHERHCWAPTRVTFPSPGLVKVLGFDTFKVSHLANSVKVLDAYLTDNHTRVQGTYAGGTRPLVNRLDSLEPWKWPQNHGPSQWSNRTSQRT